MDLGPAFVGFHTAETYIDYPFIVNDVPILKGADVVLKNTKARLEAKRKRESVDWTDQPESKCSRQMPPKSAGSALA